MDFISDVNKNLFSAVRGGEVRRVQKLIARYGLSFSQAWSEGYVLLCDSITHGHTEVTKLLLNSGCKVNKRKKKKAHCNTPLHLAIVYGNIEIVGMLLDRGAYISARNQNGSTPLHLAAAYGEKEIVDMLLNRGAYVNAKYRNGSIPLHLAVEYDNVEIVNKLLDRGAKINAINQYGNMPLHLAARNGNIEIIKKLLNGGASIVASNNQGNTPLHEAIKSGDIEVTKLLLVHCANLEMTRLRLTSEAWLQCNPELLSIAVKTKCGEVVELLLQYGVDINTKDDTGKAAIFYAIENADLKMVKLLLTSGAQLQCNPELLGIAVRKQYQEIVELLLQYGANIDAKDDAGNTAIFYAIENADLKMIKVLLTSGAWQCNPEVLSIAVKKQCREIVELLLQYTVDIDAKDDAGNNAIFYAIENTDLEMIELLLTNGADIIDNPEILHFAVENESAEIVQLLLLLGADVNAKDHAGETAISYAIEIGDLNITKLLLTNGANIKDNPELLHLAVKKACIEIVELFLQHGVDINAKDQAGLTPIFYAIKGDDLKMFKLLITNGADIKGSPQLLHVAVKNKCIEIVELLLQHGADITATDEKGSTVLHCVSHIPHFSIFYRGDIDCINSVKVAKLLLNQGANINAKKANGITPLHIAIIRGNIGIAMLYLEYGASVCSIAKSGASPLHFAALKGLSKISIMLLEFGADIDHRDENGKTALHVACEAQHVDIIKILLEYGSDINIVSKDNYMPFELTINNYSFSYDDNHLMYEYDDDGDVDDYLEYDSDDFSLISLDNAIIYHFTEHLFMMMTASLYVSERNLSALDNDFRECLLANNGHAYKKEVEIMKTEKIGDTNVFFYDFLTKTISQLAVYVRNDNIVQVLKSDGYKRKLSLYANMINGSFKRAMKRKELLEEVHKCSFYLFNMLPELPYNCNEKIFSYLSNTELAVLLDVFK